MLESIPDDFINHTAFINYTPPPPIATIRNTPPTPTKDNTASLNSTTTSLSHSPASHRSTGSPASSDSQAAPKGIDVDVVLKRRRNTIAARKYRQKRLDRISELETALDGVTRERDDLRIRLARQEAETAALKEMMRMNSGKRT